jgi:hypothetical protein
MAAAPLLSPATGVGGGDPAIFIFLILDIGPTFL